jgi:formiminoglutamate deiminase
MTTTTNTTTYWCEHAWLPPGRVARDVAVTVDGERIAAVSENAPPGPATRLPGLTIPGLANAHSHAFHRALRGRTHAGSGTFWTWREQMYAVAERLHPESYLALARAVFAEMALAGVTCVGEFHYLHHGGGGTPYEDPNAMGHALAEAARQAGLRITLLDSCYLAGGIGKPADGAQLRFSDGTVQRWIERVAALRPGPGLRIGAAVHSVRAVPAGAIAAVAEWAGGRPLHAHVSEQRAENAECLAAYGRTPTQLLADHDALRPSSTLVHATHLTDHDVASIGKARATVCLCPTTERDLADGIGPAASLVRGGARLALGSDSQAVVDPFEEARGVEFGERVTTERRGNFPAAKLLAAATEQGHACLGWPDAGRIEAGAYADLVTVGLDSPRTAGCGASAETVVFAASAADVRHVVASGRRVVAGGRHLLAGDVGAQLAAAIAAVLS